MSADEDAVSIHVEEEQSQPSHRNSGEEDQDGDAGAGKRQGLGAFLAQSPLIPNAGSTARDHLANERTFLAWIRTALGSVGLGAAFSQFANNQLGLTAGIFFILMGVVVLAFSAIRYVRVTQLMREGKFRPAKWSTMVVVLLAGVATVFALVMVASTPVV